MPGPLDGNLCPESGDIAWGRLNVLLLSEHLPRAFQGILFLLAGRARSDMFLDEQGLFLPKLTVQINRNQFLNLGTIHFDYPHPLKHRAYEKVSVFLINFSFKFSFARLKRDFTASTETRMV